MSDPILVRVQGDWPSAFLWRGHLYVVVRVLKHEGSFWKVATRDAVHELRQDGDEWYIEMSDPTARMDS